MTEWLEPFEHWKLTLLKIGLQLGFILILYFIVLGTGKKIISNSFAKFARKQRMTSTRAKTLEKLVLNIYGYFILFTIIGIVFEIFGLDIKTLLAGAGIVGLAIGFGAQGLVSDLVTGFFILLDKQIDVGDYASFAGKEGIVEEVGLRTTLLRDFDGTVHYIPNRQITSLSNHSRGNMQALVDISFPLKENVDHAMALLQQAADRVAAQEAGNIVEGPNVVGVQTLGSSEYTLRIVCKTRSMEQWKIESKLRKVIKEVLDEDKLARENLSNGSSSQVIE